MIYWLAVRVAIWSLRYLFGECDGTEPDCVACRSHMLIKELEAIK